MKRNLKYGSSPRGKEKAGIKGQAADISATGLLLKLPDASSGLEVGDKVKARFRIPPGAMPEGFESVVDGCKHRSSGHEFGRIR